VVLRLVDAKPWSYARVMFTSHDALSQPFPSDWTVGRGLDAYLAENGFTKASYEDAWTQASFLGIPFKVPNTDKHKIGIKLHDLHHVATGYGTDLVGEGEISAWEARRGLRPVGLYVAAIILTGCLVGAVAAPKRFRNAMRAEGTSALWQQKQYTYEQLLELTIAELRALLGISESGIASARSLHALAPRAA
jgi:hypothetical protein